jgi:glycosyltransferase involved in cell wall biosynthesis
MFTSTIGMVGPAVPQEFADYLGISAASLPAGLGGSPVNLLTKELLKRGRKIKLFTLDPALTVEKVFRGEQLTVCVGPYRPKARNRALDFFAAERKYLRSAIARENPDVLHAQWTYEFALASQDSGLPTVVTAHDAPINVLRHNLTVYRLVRTLMAWKAARRADLLVAVSPHVETHLRRYRFLKRDARIVPNGLPDALFSMAIEEKSIDTEICFATVLNGWGNYKNGQAAIRAFSQVRQRIGSGKLLMFGAGHGKGEEAERWAMENGLNGGVEFIGMVSHGELLRRLAENVDVLVHPALEEAQPMSIIEAMSLGIPVIGGERSGGVPWTLDGGRAGMLVDVENSGAVADAMFSLASDRKLIAEWGMRGRVLAESRYHIRAVADAYEALYEEIWGTV